MPTQKNPQNRVEVAPPAERNATEHSATEHSAIDSTHRVVNVCAVAIRNRDGLVLTVRKQGSDGFMMPGGKPEPGETPLQTACREVNEEIGLTPDPRPDAPPRTPRGGGTERGRLYGTRRNLRIRTHRRTTQAIGFAGAAGRNR